jgi:hypothetical protein
MDFWAMYRISYAYFFWYKFYIHIKVSVPERWKTHTSTKHIHDAYWWGHTVYHPCQRVYVPSSDTWAWSSDLTCHHHCVHLVSQIYLKKGWQWFIFIQYCIYILYYSSLLFPSLSWAILFKYYVIRQLFEAWCLWLFAACFRIAFV